MALLPGPPSTCLESAAGIADLCTGLLLAGRA